MEPTAQLDYDERQEFLAQQGQAPPPSPPPPFSVGDLVLWRKPDPHNTEQSSAPPIPALVLRLWDSYDSIQLYVFHFEGAALNWQVPISQVELLLSRSQFSLLESLIRAMAGAGANQQKALTDLENRIGTLESQSSMNNAKVPKKEQGHGSTAG